MGRLGIDLSGDSVILADVSLDLPAAGVTVLVGLGWQDRLPDPVASHWGPDGVNGSSSLAGLLAPLAGMNIAFAVGLWAIGFFWGYAAMTRRFAVGVAVWTSAFVDGLVVAMLLSIIAVFLPALQASRERARQDACEENLCQIGLALHQYSDSQRAFPASSGVTRKGDGSIASVEYAMAVDQSVRVLLM